jgi:hypothetical protein
LLNSAEAETLTETNQEAEKSAEKLTVPNSASLLEYYFYSLVSNYLVVILVVTFSGV